MIDILAGAKSSRYHIHFRVKKKKLEWAQNILYSYKVYPFSADLDFYTKELFQLYPQQKSVILCVESGKGGHDYIFNCNDRRRYIFAFKEETLRYFLFLKELSND